MERESSIAELRRLIKALLRRELAFSDFERAYVDFFADHAADDSFTKADHELYGNLFERLQWTSGAPSGLDRAIGYHSQTDTQDWIRSRFPEFV